jgi:4-amino-4-deoxy-L-arabinose transferase-like glycosyltransferase
VAFFPTPYLNQIMPSRSPKPDAADICPLGGEFSLIWCSGLALTSIVAVGRWELGADLRGQLLAALFCATIPNGILQATGAKNDYVLAAWLACAAYFLLRNEAIFAGLAIGLALGTKATAYLFAPGLILAIMILTWKWWRANPIDRPDRPVLSRRMSRSTSAM